MANNRTNRSTATLYTVSELCEILSAAALAVCILLALQLENKQLASWDKGTFVAVSVILFLLAIILRLYGGALEGRAEEKINRERNAGWHVVTTHRLKTLKVIGAGEDVIEVLKLRLDTPLPAEELIAWFEETLGHERAKEKLSDVLRYTRMKEAPPRSAKEPEAEPEKQKTDSGALLSSAGETQRATRLEEESGTTAPDVSSNTPERISSARAAHTYRC